MDYPPRNRAGKLLQLPPRIHGTSSTPPPLEPSKSAGTPPPPPFQNPGYGPVNVTA